MRIGPWRDWGIQARLVTVAVVPATLMFIVISVALYYSGRDEIRSDISERGRLLAAALAESSQYGLVSGNTAPLKQTLSGLLAVDQSVIAIEILDAGRAPIVAVGDTSTELDEIQVFEAVIGTQVADISSFDKTTGPHVADNVRQQAPFRASEAAGYVRVVMSALPVLQAKRIRSFLILAGVLQAAMLSVIAGLILTRRLRTALSAVMTSLRGIREGNYNVNLGSTETGELGELQTAIVEMSKGLKEVKETLEHQVEIRTAALQAAADVATAATEETRQLIAKGNAQVEEERRRIALEIHDHLNASLLFVRLEAEKISALAGNEDAAANVREIESVAQRISAMTADLYTAARGIISQLRPEVIDILGLEGAVQEMVRNYDAAHPDCRFTLRTERGFPRLNPQLSITAFRVIQEALTNVIKHARASQAEVRLSLDQKRECICVSIVDDGVGFNAKQKTRSGIGLIGMRERVTAVAGSLKVVSAPNSGTKITIELPLRKARQ